ncbi:hypothetical protein GCM10027018_17620 [Paenibacillus thermoaerophilus]
MLAMTLLLPSGLFSPTTKAEAKPIPVLLYHRVVDNPTNEWTDISTKKFEETMKYLHDHGFTTLTAEQYVDIMEGNAAPADIPEKPILLTFDDATPDFITTTVPILEKYNMNAVQFVVTGWIGGGYSITEEALRELAENHPNISLQNHSVHHAENQWNAMTKEEASAEIAQANSYIKAITGRDPVLFAYPYGHHHAATQAAMAENGIKYAFKVGTPDQGPYARARHYVKMETTLEQIASWLGGPAPETSGEEPQETLVYHETFADGLGVATQAGNAQVSPVTGKTFNGNEDGAAVQITGRTNNWDGVDIPFLRVGMEAGKTYTITVTGYLDPDVNVPAGAKALLQNVDTYQGLYAETVMQAGQSFQLKGSYTVKSEDRALRIQSNEQGKEVPFYVGDILITTTASAGEEEPGEEQPPAKPFVPVTFEDGQPGGFQARGGVETLTVTDEANHTEGGAYALKVENRAATWHGPSLRVEPYVDKGKEYKVSAWVKLISPASAQLQLSTQIGNGDGASYNNLQNKTVSVEDGWVMLEGTYRYNSLGNEYLTIYVESPNSSAASFYLDDVRFEPTDSGSIDIERNLTPLKDVYKDDFLIGNAVSLSEMEGTRLDLLKMHHNLVTAENAMKPGYAYDDEGNFDFTAEDELVGKAREHGFKIHGHVLVWHQQSREALHTDANGTPLPRDEALANLKKHVQTVVGHFQDQVISWDVVNEAMADNPPNPSDWKSSLRPSGWLRAIGPDYIEYAFRFAKEVIQANGWDIKLYYNDYNDDNQRKAEAIYQMVKDINERYAAETGGERLIDGIGMQAHYNLNTNPENVRLSMEKFISLGVEIGVTELDITAGSDHVLTEEQAQKQAYLYARLFKLYKEKAEHISRVTLWGLNDATSWRAAQNPLLFDRNLKAKPAYYAVINPEKYIEEYDGGERVEANRGQAVWGTPKIDGEIDPVWSTAPILPVNRYQMAWQGANGFAKALWDNSHLYVLFHVNDSRLDKSNANAWEQDSIEVFVDENNDKVTYYQDDDGQYRVNFDNETSFNPNGIAAGFESATSVSGTGYIVEVKIPFRTITPTTQMEIGFDAQINDAQNSARQSVATWNDLTGRGFEDPSVFGVLTLIDKPDDSGNNPNENPGTGMNPPDIREGSGPIVPVTTNTNGQVVGTVTIEQLNRAIANAADANGKKPIVIELAKQANATSYEVQLPAAGLRGQDEVNLSVKTELATLTIPGRSLMDAASSAEHIAIRIAPASTQPLDAAARANAGNRPAISVHLLADGASVASLGGNHAATVSIPYTPGAAERLRPDYIVVWRLDDHGNVTAIPNGRYDEAAGSVVFATRESGSFAVAYVVHAFDDIASLNWAKQAINAMTARDLLKSEAENRFAPQAPVHRAEAIALLVRTLDLNADTDRISMFGDVAADADYYEELAVAKALGIVSGFDGNIFRPDSPITRQDMMVLTARALAAAGAKPNEAGALSLDSFSDAGDVSPYARTEVEALVQGGIINGYQGYLAPQQSLTRAEAAVILYRIWKW